MVLALRYLVWGDPRHFSQSFPGDYKAVVRVEKCWGKVLPGTQTALSNVGAPPGLTWNHLQFTFLARCSPEGKADFFFIVTGGEWMESEGRKSAASESETDWAVAA